MPVDDGGVAILLTETMYRIRTKAEARRGSPTQH